MKTIKNLAIIIVCLLIAWFLIDLISTYKGNPELEKKLKESAEVVEANKLEIQGLEKKIKEKDKINLALQEKEKINNAKLSETRNENNKLSGRLTAALKEVESLKEKGDTLCQGLKLPTLKECIKKSTKLCTLNLSLEKALASAIAFSKGQREEIKGLETSYETCNDERSNMKDINYDLREIISKDNAIINQYETIDIPLKDKEIKQLRKKKKWDKLKKIGAFLLGCALIALIK